MKLPIWMTNTSKTRQGVRQIIKEQSKNRADKMRDCNCNKSKKESKKIEEIQEESKEIEVLTLNNEENETDVKLPKRRKRQVRTEDL